MYFTSIANTTHQLDYYVNMPAEAYDPCSGCGATDYMYPRAIKQYNGLDVWYWLRTSTGYGDFRSVRNLGLLYVDVCTGEYGLAPAFRIG